MLKSSVNKLLCLALIAFTGASVTACDNTPTSATVPNTHTPRASHDGRIYDPKWGFRHP